MLVLPARTADLVLLAWHLYGGDVMLESIIPVAAAMLVGFAIGVLACKGLS